jgi:hypothetical protein
MRFGQRGRKVADQIPARIKWAAGAVVATVALAAVLIAPSAAGAQTTPVTASDNFVRANGSLGPNWTDFSVGGLAIVYDEVTGTHPFGNSGDIRTAETYTSDQWSQIQVGSVVGSQWIGTAVRAQNGGLSLYVGIYYWNNNSPVLMLFKEVNGAWTELGGVYHSGSLAAGTPLKLMVVGSTLTLSENGVVVITATDSTLTGGAPAIMADGNTTASNWSGGDA